MYVVNTEHETHVVRRSFSCTKRELLRELSFAIKVNPLKVTFVQSIHGDQQLMSDQQLTLIYKGQTQLSQRTIK